MKLLAKLKEPLALSWNQGVLVLKSELDVFVDLFNSSIKMGDTLLRVKLLSSWQTLQGKLLISSGSHRVGRQ